jgi:hypothetical protein
MAEVGNLHAKLGGLIYVFFIMARWVAFYKTTIDQTDQMAIIHDDDDS